MDGNWKPGNVWGGVKEGMVRVDSFGPRVPLAVQTEVLAAQQRIAKGQLHPFHATEAVLDNTGKTVIAKGQTLTDAQILGINWLVAGVQGKVGP